MHEETGDGGEAAAPGNGTVVWLAGVGKTFPGGTVALEDFSLTVGRGEFVSLLGPSGCGKSTVLRIIAGLIAPSAGRVDWPGAREAADHAISFVFQEPTLMPWATVFGNVHLPLRIKGVKAANARGPVIEALAQVGLEGFADAYPRELSGGMKMRASIARALVTKPRLLLMDEPFAALDEITRFRLNNDLLVLWRQLGWTVVFVTHSVFESVYLSSRVMVLAARPGRVVEEIAIDEPYPRDEEFRTSARYAQICRETSHALSAALGAGEGA
jgi:NitT/TauT family transport system ATP-binding protein